MKLFEHNYYSPRAQQYSTPCMTACWGVRPQVNVLNSEVDFDNEH